MIYEKKKVMNACLSKEDTSDRLIAHIGMLQGIINRMASNSANCKTWAIAIISALIAVFASNDRMYGDGVWICYIPIFMFFFLDCYYLGIERRVIRAQTEFMEQGNDSREYFVLKYDCGVCNDVKATLKAVMSFSTLPFYGAMVGVVFYLMHC